jgi:DNA primase
VLTFVQEIERIDFWDAVKELAKLGNINLEKYQLDRQKVEDYADEKEKIKRMHTLAQQFFTDELKKNIHALTYLKEKRKLDDKTIQYFGIGYAPESHYALLQFLKSKGFNDNDLLQASLAKK